MKTLYLLLKLKNFSENLKMLLKVAFKKLNHCLFQKKRRVFILLYTHSIYTKGGQGSYIFGEHYISMLQKQYIETKPDYNYCFNL